MLEISLNYAHLDSSKGHDMADSSDNVVKLEDLFKQAGKDTRRASEKKFGKPVMDVGFCITPSLLMKGQARIGLNPVQFNIVMHLLDQWWTADRRPWPTKALLAERMDMSPRQIQRQ